MTGEELLLQREAQRCRNRSRKYKKGYGNHEDFNPSVIRGKDQFGETPLFLALQE
ncbi:hypothetical protein F442_07962 [Phytophthora nicotianae P10297]|uniref:Uncharacterized protein n=3 Tax=Phytophthora nicotianae TaxID=4792 RepID=V9F8I1_PHYNI|nr:hypothetical protein F443_08029 [Phytophthora nicotianae P1569]ETL94340.1 hypothetical protein L917_07668 [Phytophthora nicotianae]ETP45663.1 hypothetical protein F442_07962 [Phytophthora nicotianae P10297]